MNPPGPKQMPPGASSDAFVLLALIAARARNRAPLAWLVGRFTRTMRPRDWPRVRRRIRGRPWALAYLGGESGIAAVEELMRDPKAHILGLIARLEAAGAVQVQRSGPAVASVSLSRNAERRFLFRQVSARIMAVARTKGVGIARIAELTRNSERTVWRWVAGDFAPSHEDIFKIASAAGLGGPADWGRQAVILSSFMIGVGAQLDQAGLTAGEQVRALAWLEKAFAPHVALIEEAAQRAEGVKA